MGEKPQSRTASGLQRVIVGARRLIAGGKSADFPHPFGGVRRADPEKLAGAAPKVLNFSNFLCFPQLITFLVDML